MFRIVLVAPEIPPNTGNVIRLAANIGCELHLVEPLGFSMDDKLLRRAGLDYHEFADVRRHADWQALLRTCAPDAGAASRSARAVGVGMSTWPGRRATGWSSAAKVRACRQPFGDGFDADHLLRLPMRPGQRSLNLSNAVAVAAFEAWRQIGFAGSA